MANDRVFIKCKGCGGWNLLLKHLGAGSYTVEDTDILDWLDSHAECHPRCYAGEPVDIPMAYFNVLNNAVETRFNPPGMTPQDVHAHAFRRLK